ncbi:MAG: vWA domain-containing protein [Pseudomonadota bacterium]
MHRPSLTAIACILAALFAVSGSSATVYAQGSAIDTRSYQLRRNWPVPLKSDKDMEVAPDLTAKNYVLIFDGSGSMSETNCAGPGKTKAHSAKEAVNQWFRSLPAGANVGLVAFYYNTWSNRALKAGAGEELIRLTNAVRPGGHTPLGEAMRMAYDMMEQQARRQLGYGEYTIVVITDGMATDPGILDKWSKYILDNTPILIYTIGFCIDERHSLNQPGRTFYRSAHNPDALKKGLREVLAEAEKFSASQAPQ